MAWIWTSIVALLLAVPPVWPYGYYVLLRFFVCLTCAYQAFQCHKQKQIRWRNVLAGMAIAFNPLVPFHLGKMTWSLVDLAVAVILFKYARSVKAGRISLSGQIPPSGKLQDAMGGKTQQN